jgi:PAS domain S-box-containing protein
MAEPLGDGHVNVAARGQEQLLQSAVESTSDFVVITDAAGKILFVNQAVLKRYRYDERELLGRPVSILQSPNNPPNYCRDAHEATLRGTWAGELLDVTKDGEEFPIFLTSTVIRDAAGNSVAAVGIGREITECKKAENALRSTQEFLISLLEHTPAPIYVVSADDRFLLVNGAWEKLTGKRREDVLGCKVKDVFPAEAARLIRDSDLAVFNTKGPVSTEQHLELRDGPHVFHTVKFPLRDAAGHVTAVAGVSMDITAHRRAEVALRRQEHESSRLADNLPDIIARFDPQLRHVYVNQRVERTTGMPASAFIGKTNRELGMPAQLVEQWEAALREVFAAGREKTIEFSYPTATGPAHFESRLIPEFGATGQVETVLGINRDVTERKRLEQQLRAAQKTEGAVNSELVQTLGNQLGQIRGFAEWLTHRLPAGERDRGYAERIAVTAAHAQELIRPFGASVRAPLVPNGEPARPASTILAVEDDEITREFLQQALEADGFRVLTAADGAAGLEVFRAQAGAIDLVVTDVVMPKLSGDAMVAAMRKLAPSVRVLVVSGYARGETATRLREQNVTAFLEKPFTVAALLQQVHQLIGRAASR